jgi:hypothetical protein
LRDILHVIVFCVHVAYVARWVAAAVLGKVTHLSTVETGPLWALALVGLFLGVRCVAICFLHVDHIAVSVVASVLASVIWHPSAQQVHWYLDVVVCEAWGRG